MPQSELNRVDGYERQQRASQLWYLRQDFAEGTADTGYLPTVNAIYGKNHGFPEESAAISDLLGHPEGLQNLRDELEQFVQAYRENRELLRFHFHRPQRLLEQLSDLQREPLHFTAAEGYAPQRRFFISGDEIDNLLRGGKRSTDYRLAVYSFYRNHTERKERENFLKHYHGEYSGHSSGNDDVTYQLSKGVSFSHGSITAPYAKVELKWNAVEKRVSTMIAQGRFLTDEDRAAMPQYEKHQLARNIRTFFENVPQILNKIKVIQEVGLGYIKLGQSSTTLSGGESQRVKLATELSKRDTGKTLYILDEPTTGLHFEDIRVLMNVLNKLVDKGNTVIVIEHNLDVIKMADYIIDMGPDGGKGGGQLLSCGTPEEVAKSKKGYTPKFLKEELKG